MQNLTTLIPEGESGKLEFKTSFNQEVIESVCAFANKKGGVVVIGLKSKDKVLGVQVGSETLQTQNSSWDYVLDEQGSMDEISLEKVNSCIERINARGYHIPQDPVDFLKKNRLMRDGKLSFAAQMLFAKDWHVNTAVQMGRFIDPVHVKDRDDAHGDLITQVDQLFGFVKKHINCAVVISGKPENDLVWDYPLPAIREIILNMIVHRDYRSASESCIKIFDDRIEFFNPGKLLDDLTVESLLSGNYLSTLRNKAVANVFYMLGEIEKYGSGISRVMEMFCKAGNPDLKIEATGAGFKVTAFAKGVKVDDKVENDGINDRNDGINGENDGINDQNDGINGRNDGINSTQVTLLDFIKEHPDCKTKDISVSLEIPLDTVSRNLSALLKKNLIERRGSKKTGGYYLT